MPPMLTQLNQNTRPSNQNSNRRPPSGRSLANLGIQHGVQQTRPVAPESSQLIQISGKLISQSAKPTYNFEGRK